MLKFTPNSVTFKKLKQKSAFLKISAQAFEAGDFLNIFFWFWGFWGSFSYRIFFIKKRVCHLPTLVKLMRIMTIIMLIMKPSTFLKKRLWHTCFPVNFVNFSRTPFLQNLSVRLLLELEIHKFWQLCNSRIREIFIEPGRIF